MKSKMKLLVVIFLVIIVCIPIVAFASTKLRILVAKENSVVQKEKLLQEKQEYLNSELIEDKNMYSLEKDVELQNKLLEKRLENQQEQQKIETIINKFYKEEYNAIKQEVINNDGIKDGTLDPNGPEIKLYHLIMNIIETKELEIEELKILKQFINDSASNIKGNDELKWKMQKISQE